MRETHQSLPTSQVFLAMTSGGLSHCSAQMNSGPEVPSPFHVYPLGW